MKDGATSVPVHSEIPIGSVVVEDPLHNSSSATAAWSLGNTSEALPGVQTPLGWTFWKMPYSRGCRRGCQIIGIYSRGDVALVADEDIICPVFFGRYANSVDWLRKVANVMPGFSGDDVELSVFGSTRPEVPNGDTRRRYPIIFAKLPWAMVTVERRLKDARARTDRWRRASLAALERDPSSASARGTMSEALDRFEEVIALHIAAYFITQSMMVQLYREVAKAGVDVSVNQLLAGSGDMEEIRLLGDLWDTSRDRLSLQEFILRHGYHGPAEGCLHSHSWREAPTKLEQQIATLARMSEDQSPLERVRARLAQSQTTLSELMGAVDRRRRPIAKATISLGQKWLPTREIGKSAFLQLTDVGRASARVLGSCLHADGLIDDPEDVFFLTCDEFVAPTLREDARAVVAFRKERRDAYESIELPSFWIGQPEPVRSTSDTTPSGDPDLVVGLGASSGKYVGTARIAADSGADIDPGDVIICHTTDPGWAPIMQISGALVVDIGGPVSHAAIVARELGIPCVVNTVSGTRSFSDGDLVEVDGDTGTVRRVESR